jgi:hypothetical protein
MEEKLSALFEKRVEKVEQELRMQRKEMEKKTAEMEKQRVEMEKKIESLRSVVARVESDNTHLNSAVTRLLTDLTEVHTDLRILHPLPYARLHLQKCINHQLACNDAVNAFISLHTLKMINSTPSLTLQLQELKIELKKAWDARFSAAFLCEPPPTLESILWIVSKSGYTKEVAPFMNLSKSTRECKNLQRVMREVRNWREFGGGMTQLLYFCMMGMTSSMKRMLEMKSIDVEAKLSDELGGGTCMKLAAYCGHLDICRLLIDKGAQVNAIDSGGWTPLHWAAEQGHVEMVRLLCDRGADIEASNKYGSRPLHLAARNGHISAVKELIEVRNAEINARDNIGMTALSFAGDDVYTDVADYLVSHGGIVYDDDDQDDQ